jgi:putative heme-binding domain-containing protein
MIHLLAALLLLQAKPQQKEDVPPDPELERKTFKLAEGFEVNLFAADPLVAKPIQMNFDSRGRLWVATSAVYPQVLPGEVPDDKIVILEDTDGDGKADRSHVWADKLFIPTGVEPGDGGAYVANSTEILHLEDTDGDGKADRRRVVLSGFGTEDTHHIIHTFRWGPEGDFYFNQSIYIHSHVETPHGVRRLGGAGVWRFRPKSLQLEIFCKGMCNPWGHTIDAWGQSFGTDGAGGDGIHFLMPGATYPHFPTGERHFPGLNPGQPKFCAHEILSGRHLPEDWRGTVLANDFRANRIARFQLSDDGAGFSSKQMPDLLTSTDRAFRPVDVRMGPDGAIYVADWYNPIINHGEVSFRDPRRDKTHGRIWRISAKGRPLVERPKLAGAPVRELLERLKDPEDWTRHFAKRELASRDPKEVLPVLAEWTKGLADEHDKLEAFWAHKTLGVLDPGLLRMLLRSPEPRARAAAVRAVAHDAARVPDALRLLEAAVADEHPRVRLEAVRALRELPSEKSIEIAMRALDRPVDRFLDYSLWLTAYETQAAWLPAFQSGTLTFGGNAKHAEFALRSARSPGSMGELLKRLKAGYLSMETRLNALEIIAAAGTPDDLRDLFAGRYDAAFQAKVLAALVQAARERNVRPSGSLDKVKAHFDAHEEALVLAGAWKLEALRPELSARAETGNRGAVEGLVLLGGPESAAYFRGLAAKSEPRLRVTGVLGLAVLDPSAAAAAAPDAFAADPGAVASAFLQRKGGAEALAAALDGKPVSADAARLGLRAMYAAGRQEPALVAVLNRVVGLKTRARELSADELKAAVADVAAKGDPARGEAVFRRRELSCFQCHAIGGAGGIVGPDLLSLGASAPVDYILESVLLPEKKQKEGYASLQVLTTSGDVLSGVLVRQGSDGSVVLRDALRDEITIPKAQIELRKPVGSIMPAGLADLLTDQEFTDLVRFLAELGKPGPYAVGSAPLIRRWRVLEPAPAAAYSLVSGALPLDGIGAVRGDFEVTTAGKFRVRLNGAQGLAVEADGKPVEAAGELEFDWGVGIHALTFRISGRAEPLRVEVEEAPGSPGRGRPVHGR